MKTLKIIILILFFSSLLQAQGPVAAYGFNENTGTTVSDVSGNNNTGNVGTATWTTGKYGNALQFNGTSSKVAIANTPLLQLTNKMTLEAWVSPSVASVSYTDLIAKGHENYYILATSSPSGFPVIGSHMADGNWFPVNGISALPINTWSHVAATYDGSIFRLYVNGVQVASGAKTGTFGISTNPLEIGGDTQTGQYFNGKIDEVRVYNRALSAAEIVTDMNTPIAPVSTITQVDKHPDDPVTVQWDYDTTPINGFGLYAGATPTGPWTFYDGITDATARTFAFVSPDRSTYFTMNACRQTASTNGFCSVFSNIVKINCVPLSEQFLWQTFTTRQCQ